MKFTIGVAVSCILVWVQAAVVKDDKYQDYINRMIEDMNRDLNEISTHINNFQTEIQNIKTHFDAVADKAVMDVKIEQDGLKNKFRAEVIKLINSGVAVGPTAFDEISRNYNNGLALLKNCFQETKAKIAKVETKIGKVRAQVAAVEQTASQRIDDIADFLDNEVSSSQEGKSLRKAAESLIKVKHEVEEILGYDISALIDDIDSIKKRCQKYHSPNIIAEYVNFAERWLVQIGRGIRV